MITHVHFGFNKKIHGQLDRLTEGPLICISIITYSIDDVTNEEKLN